MERDATTWLLVILGAGLLILLHRGRRKGWRWSGIIATLAAITIVVVILTILAQ